MAKIPTPSPADVARITGLVDRLKDTAGPNHFIGGLMYHLRVHPTTPMWQAMLAALETAESSGGDYMYSLEEMAEQAEWRRLNGRPDPTTPTTQP